MKIGELAGQGRTQDVKLEGGRELTIRALKASESRALREAFARPGVPMIPRPGENPTTAPMVENPGDPRYILDLDRWEMKVQCAETAAAAGLETADGMTFETARREGKVELWAGSAAGQLADVLTLDEVRRVWKSLQDLQDPIGVNGSKVEAAAKNCGAGATANPARPACG